MVSFYIPFMRCPYCKHTEDKVIDSRTSGDSIRRRRECLSCGKRFTTYEYIESVPMMVMKRNGTTEPFQRDKLEKSILLACTKRPVTRMQIQELVQQIENELADSYTQEVSWNQVGAKVMERLADLDAVAYVRFASVYRQFKDVGEFVQEIKQFPGRSDV
jgi:transcriptional repressor NrdR